MFTHKAGLITYEIDCRHGRLGFAQWSFHGKDLATGATVWSGSTEHVSFYEPIAYSTGQLLISKVCATSPAAAPILMKGTNRE